jgi:hypothetical protein
MTSIPAYVKQIPTDARNFIAVSSLYGIISGYNEATNSFAPVSWAASPFNFIAGVSQGGPAASTIGAGGKLRDMGKTQVSSGRTFRKVQALLAPTLAASFGVGGQSEQAAPTADYFTGYIELGWEGQGSPAPVARAP